MKAQSIKRTANHESFREERAGKRGTLFITVSTPWAVRNYFHTGIIRQLAATYDVVAIATPALAACLFRDGYAKEVEVVEYDPGVEPTRWRLLRQARKKLYMESRASETERLWERYGGRPWHQRVAGMLARRFGAMLFRPPVLTALTRVDVALNRSNALEKIFRTRRPAVLFATHVSSFFEESLLRSANRCGVPSMLMVLSWDHLSTKVVLSHLYRKILVWTSTQRQELLSTYPFYEPQQVEVVGVPHFDAYMTPTPTTRQEWCSTYGLDPKKRTVVFYTAPQGRMAEQHVILEELAGAIDLGKEFPPDLQLLIKCHPFDNTDRYDDVVDRYPFVGVHRTNLPPGADLMDWLPERSEIDVSRDCLTFADVVVNIYSTVTIEAALFDRPVVHVAFDPSPPPSGRIPCREYYNFTHFRPVVDTGASRLADSQEDFHEAIREALECPGRRRAERQNLVALFGGPLDGGSCERVAKEIAAYLPASINRK